MGLFDLFSNDSAEKAAAAQKAGLEAGRTTAYNYLDSGTSKLQDQYSKALGYYEPYSTAGTSATNMYSNALGLNGATGTQAAQDAYTQGAGYQFNMDQGLQALERARSAGGMLSSGNTDTDAMKYASGLASQDYNSWLSNLAGLSSQGLTAASGQSGVSTTLGDRLYGSDATKAQIGWNTETGKGNADATALMNNYNVGGNILGAATLGAKLLGFGM